MLKQHLQFKLSQKLSPQQIQLMKLIQLPTQAFEQRLKQELDENPALEGGKEESENDFDADLDINDDYNDNESINAEDINVDEYLSDDEIPDYRTQANNYSSDDEDGEEHEVIDDGDKIIIKSNGTVKEVKKLKSTANVWISSDGDDDEHEIIEIKTDDDGESVIIKNNGKDKKVIKSKSIWISDDSDDDEETIFELNDSDSKLFISAGDDKKQPLYVIDGKEVKKNEMKDLDPNDIESINVLKGEAAIKKYGKKAKNGVIEITTKM